MNEAPIWRIWPVLLLAFVLQTTLLARWGLWGVHLDLPLLVVIAVALILGWRIGMVFGLVAGLITGFLIAKNPGAWAFSRLAVGAILGLSNRGAVSDNLLMPPLLAASGTLLADAIVLLIAPTDFPLSWWLRHTSVQMLTNALLIWPLYWLLSRWLRPPTKLMFS